MTVGRVVNVAPGRSVVRLDTGEIVVAVNALNTRTPPRSRVTLTRTPRGWHVVGRER